MQIFPSYVNFIRGYPPLHGYSNGENGGKKKIFRLIFGYNSVQMAIIVDMTDMKP
jgi:hypothetical protein